MNRSGTILLLVMSLAALHAVALEVQHSPYDKIPIRNLFKLRVAAVDPQSSGPVAKPRPKVVLTGITTVLGRPLAFITVEGTKLELTESVMVGCGQAVNGIEVKSIDKGAGVVTILNGDEMQVLNFESAKSTGIRLNEGLTAPPSPPVLQARPEATMTPEEQVALIELQRVKFQQESNPIRALLPPTELTSADGD